MIDETSQVDLGPFDIELTLNGDGVFAADKSVSNHTGQDWGRFVMELGSGSGTDFVPSTASDGLGFDAFSYNRDDSGAFANVFTEEDRILFTGFLEQGDMARFVVFVNTNTPAEHKITLRQRALTDGIPNCVNHYEGKISFWGPFYGAYSGTGGYIVELRLPVELCKDNEELPHSGFGMLTPFQFFSPFLNGMVAKPPSVALGEDGYFFDGVECWQGDLTWGCEGYLGQLGLNNIPEKPLLDGFIKYAAPPWAYKCYIWGKTSDLLFGRERLRGEALCVRAAYGDGDLTEGLLDEFPTLTASLDFKATVRPLNICGNDHYEPPYEQCEPPGTPGYCDDNCQLAKEACCLPDGCQDLTPRDCSNAGGLPKGAGTDCSIVICEVQPIGACCLPDTSCAELTLLSCDVQGGTYLGDGSSCDSLPCEK